MELPADLLEPIPGDNPAGEDLRYEPLYDEVKLARTEEDDIPVGEWQRERKVADYREVVKLTTTALATRTKDLQLAAWLAEALLREEGFAGFHQGLEVIRGLLREFWDDLYPELEDGDSEFRAMPLEWVSGYLDVPIKSVPVNAAGHHLLDYLDAQAVGYESEDDSYEKKEARTAAIAEGKLTAEDFDAGFARTSKEWYKELVAGIDHCLASIRALDEESHELFGEFAPSFRGLVGSIEAVQRVARKLLDRKLEEDPDPVEIEAAPGIDGAGTEVSEAPTAGGLGAMPQGTSTGAVPAVLASRADAAARIGEAARFLRSEDPRDPAPYALIRGFRWAEVRQGGDPPDPRLLEAPPTQTRTRLKSLLLDEKWSALVEAGEDVMATPYGRGWLDLQRYVVTALDALGDEYAAAGRLVRSSLAGLLRDVPSLPEVTLMDDSPTANLETRSWLEAEGLFDAEGAASRRAGSAERGAGSPTGAQLLKQALARVRSGQTDDGVALLLQAAERATHPREGFLTRTEAAAIMIDHGLDAVARPILDDMVELIARHDLDKWESGETVARPLGLLYRVKKAADEHADDLYERIVRLDPVHALRLRSEERRGQAAEAGAGDEESS